MSDTQPQESSLDRYLESQAGLLLSHASMRRGMVIMSIVGAIMLLMALSITIASLLTHNPAMMGGAIGPSIGGIVNVVISQALRRRAKPALEVNANLSPEARSLMANLMKDVYGWPKAWGAVEPHSIFNSEHGYMGKHERIREREVWRGMLARGSWGNRQRSAKECLNPEAFDVLNRAAFQYNRISGILGTSNAEVDRFRASIKGAADQAMADAFHVGHLLEEYPEGSGGAKAKAEEEISGLTELADRLDHMQQQAPPAIETQVARPSPIWSLLEELRLDQLARSELGTTPEDEERLKAQG